MSKTLRGVFLNPRKATAAESKRRQPAVRVGEGCPAILPFGPPFMCTCSAEHKGDHVATVSDGRVCARWTNKK